MIFGLPSSGFLTNSSVDTITASDLEITGYLPDAELTLTTLTNADRSTVLFFLSCGANTSTGTKAPPSTFVTPCLNSASRIYPASASRFSLFCIFSRFPSSGFGCFALISRISDSIRSISSLMARTSNCLASNSRCATSIDSSSLLSSSSVSTEST